ncbi:hypothetical protein ACQR5V_21590 [Xanthomonas oryzae pv. oryzicola]|uniref:hypothetical protein n=1 Tax=Xanthomonas oryzae TaxID=347 RepID=UPI000DE13272|nr:hypothetical protein [Xanthomonas oryzae]RBL28459.1 hypothetical protein BRN31_14900 [Xanthomonas oryzae pv. oryzae]
MSAFVDVLVMDFEQYAAQHGASMAGIGDAGTHKRGRNQSDKQWRRLLASVDRRSREILARREELRAEYERRIAAGKIRQPTRLERLTAAAAGHPDLASTQAARRILARVGGAP